MVRHPCNAYGGRGSAAPSRSRPQPDQRPDGPDKGHIYDPGVACQCRACVITELRTMAIDTRKLDTRESASWIIVDTFTGRAICETFNAELLPLLNVARYRAMPSLEYLGQLNARIRTTGSDQPNWIA